MKIQPALRRFTVDEYQRMGQAGILHEDDRVELIGGEVLQMTPIGARHAACVDRLGELLHGQLPGGLLLRVQNPIRLGEYDEPQPDLSVVLRRDYRDSLPGPQDVLLVIEVSDTSLQYDREVRMLLYARAGIPEAWVVDLAGELIERYSGPATPGYRLIQRTARGETLHSESVPELVLSIDDVFGA